MRRLKVLSLSVLLATFGFAPTASADPITGILNITGSVDVTATTLDFRPPETDGFGIFTTKEPGTGYFDTIVSDPLEPTGGDMLDLALVPTAGFTNVAIGDTFVDDWMYNFRDAGGFDGYDYSNLTFDLTHVVDQSGTAAICDGSEGLGDTCFLGPFLLTVGEEGTGILMEVRGYFQDPLYDDTFYGGRFTTQVGYTISEILDILENGGADASCLAGVSNGTLCASYSANFEPISEIPEPASLLLFGSGALVLGYRRRRAAKKAAGI